MRGLFDSDVIFDSDVKFDSDGKFDSDVKYLCVWTRWFKPTNASQKRCRCAPPPAPTPFSERLESAFEEWSWEHMGETGIEFILFSNKSEQVYNTKYCTHDVTPSVAPHMLCPLDVTWCLDVTLGIQRSGHQGEYAICALNKSVEGFAHWIAL